ncbi:MAG: Gfo/Idh/MocA family protein, partial [Actinomycetes bacterium]
MRGPVRVGVIGVGNIGAYHASYLAGGVAGAVLAAVSDADRGRAEEVAASAGGGPLGGTGTARVHADGASLIGDPTVDAVVVASPNDTHAELVLECLALGKPVLCEKPLGSTVKSCLQVAESEAAGGRHLVQVGFMRRYDRAHRRLKAAVASGRIGDPLIVHCAHRNRASGPGATSAGSLMGSAIHEIDTMRWILGQELVGATVVRARRSPLVTGALCDPQLVLLETGEGVVVDVEVFVNCGYGYDVRCEVVGSEGTATLTSGEEPTVASVGRSGHAVPADWR